MPLTSTNVDSSILTVRDAHVVGQKEKGGSANKYYIKGRSTTRKKESAQKNRRQ